MLRFFGRGEERCDRGRCSDGEELPQFPRKGLRRTHKSSGLCLRRSCPLNPPILGDFEVVPPRHWGARGGEMQRFELDREMCVRCSRNGGK